MTKRALAFCYLKSSICIRLFSQRVEKMVYLLTPPDKLRGMTTLDRAAFTTTVEIPCLKLSSVPNNKIMPVLKKYLLKQRHWKPVQKVDDNTIIYLDPAKIEKFDDIDEADRKIISTFTTELVKTTLTLNYENWQPDQIFKAVLPQELESPTSYTKVGHILHLNLRDNQLPYKTLIAQVYLDFASHTKTVVNKLNNIETEFRHFPMEILAGDNNTVTTVKENNCIFTFDFAKVYWNSRLCTEHTNLLAYMNKNDVLYDVFAGVGPFAIPAARKHVIVLANDLNPESFKWLQSNALTNNAKNINCYNVDGREFLRNYVKPHLLNRRRENTTGTEHIAMNLPAIAHEFLDVFRDWMNDVESIEICKKSILVHLYCFVKVNKFDDPKPIAQSLVENSLRNKLCLDVIKNIHHVRNVAPNKEMMRVSFYLTRDMMINEEPVRKKPKIHSTNDLTDNTNIIGNNGQKQEGTEDKKCI